MKKAKNLDYKKHWDGEATCDEFVVGCRVKVGLSTQIDGEADIELTAGSTILISHPSKLFKTKVSVTSISGKAITIKDPSGAQWVLDALQNQVPPVAGELRRREYVFKEQLKQSAK